MNTTRCVKGLLALIACAWSLHAMASRIDFSPTTTNTTVGSSFSVDIVISGLNVPTLPLAVTDFDLDISYNPSQLTATGVSFGTDLPSPVGFFGFDYLSSPGIVDLYATSFDDYGTLQGLQGDSFTLATLTFLALAPPGTDSLAFVQNAFFIVDMINADNTDLVNTANPELCQSLSCIVVGDPASVVIREASTVPEPNPLLLFGAAALALVAARRPRAISR